MGMIHSVDVARYMEVSKSCVCHAMALLQESGFLIMDEDHFLHLIEQGCKGAERIYGGIDFLQHGL